MFERLGFIATDARPNGGMLQFLGALAVALVVAAGVAVWLSI